MTEAGEIHSRAWIPPSIHNAGEFGFPLLILITYLADYFFLFIALPVFFFLLCIVRKNNVPWEASLRQSDRWWRQNKRRGKCQPGSRGIRECPRVGGNWSIPFDDLTGIPSRLFRGCTFGVLGRDVKIFRSVDSETKINWYPIDFFFNKFNVQTKDRIILNRRSGLCAQEPHP